MITSTNTPHESFRTSVEHYFHGSGNNWQLFVVERTLMWII